jgi:hypothetical protein
MLRHLLHTTLYLALAGAFAAPTRADVITVWNAALLAAVRTTSTNPPRASRAMAMVHLAVFEAVNGVEDEFQPYVSNGKPAHGASAVAAAAAAGHSVLSAVFPSQAAGFDAQLSESLAGIPTGPRNKGVAWGRQCAEDILALRSADNSGLVIPYFPPLGPGYWIPTPPAFAPALLPNWPLVTPFCLPRGSQLRSPGAPALTSAAYAAAFNEVKDLGRVDSASRTPDQSQIALFWADGGGTETPPGHWMRIASEVSDALGLPLVEKSRLFALLGMGVADAAIVSWDSKYAFHHWRPVTGIREAATDGNPDTVEDLTWTPFIATPPFPTYTSGHSTFSATSARILARVLRNDGIGFSTTSQGLPGVTRSFSGFWQAAAEAGASRIYGGIHWQYDNQDALAAGSQLGDLVVDSFLRRIGDLNDDDRVNRSDLAILLSRMGQSDPSADLNHDGIVDSRDRVILVQHLDRGQP